MSSVARVGVMNKLYVTVKKALDMLRWDYTEEPLYAGKTRQRKRSLSIPDGEFLDDDRDSRPYSKAGSGSNGKTEKLEEFLEFLTSAKTETAAVGLLKTGYEDNMKYKKTRYEDLIATAATDVDRERAIAQDLQQSLRTASSANDSDNWSIFEGVSRPFVDARRRVADIQFILDQIEDNMTGAGVGNGRPPARGDKIWTIHAGLVKAAENMSNFGSQPHVVDAAIDIVQGFLKNPASIRTKFLNFMMVGGAGVGKTTLVTAIAELFASAGMFVGNRVREAGRAEFIGEYEGQTVARTRAFLTSSLDCGVVFVDEAYAMTPWDKGKPEGYGSEAVSAIVEFTTRYKGLYCIMCAGYEKEMRRYFLPTNPGLERRFPYRFILNNFTVDDLMFVFKKATLKELGFKVADGRSNTVVKRATKMFSHDAWELLKGLLTMSRRGESSFIDDEYDSLTNQHYFGVASFQPQYPLLYKALVENQAGSMTNLAEEAANLLIATISLSDVSTFRKKQREATEAMMPEIDEQDDAFMRRIVRTRLENTAMSDWPSVKAELDIVIETLGLEYASDVGD